MRRYWMIDFGSRQKSLISNTGAFEFAKRFFVREGTRDLSTVLGHVIMSKWTIGLALLRDKYNIKKAYLPV
jgi:hypothetical protein